jgi:SAM-dependent methyltransferase
MAKTTVYRHRQIWQQKPVLQTIYKDFYDRVAAAVAAGTTLEIGGTIGGFKEHLRMTAPAAKVVASDIQFCEWLDCIADAQRLPFAQGSFANIVMIDVCHHLEFPLKFLLEAQRVLAAGGRIIMVEPAITWGSSLFYRFLHHEPVRIAADPLGDGTPDPRRDPYSANQAIPTLLATRDFARFHDKLPSLKIKRIDWFSLAVYPLSGGFKRWSLIPARLAAQGLQIERRLEPMIGRFLGFRMMMIIDKIPGVCRPA